MIHSFANPITEKLFLGESLTKKERNKIGQLNIQKAKQRLHQLDHANEKYLLTAGHLRYHKLHGTNRYAIDADSRRSPWRITFTWRDAELVDVECVQIEDTH